MNALVLDDDKRICNLIKSLLEKYFIKSIKQIDIATSVKDAIKAINETNYQLFLFDIHLGKESSFDVLNVIENNIAKVIFITGHEKYAINAIKANAVDYILKPIQIQEFKNSIEKALSKIKNEQKENNVSYFTSKQENSLMLKALESIRLVKLNDIVYLEASGAYTDVYLENNERVTVTKHLKEFENKLEKTGFFRVHNSFIINALKMKGISKRDGLTVEMNNNKSITISSRRKDDFISFIETHLEI
ncbi:LytR/AlgR family response regulator transcription factor [Hanstruepera ponticola]|uniref:LytR/AlgR family response regulator transcription factor n=1 Tax=Hanstruepera ponticola TaxID=2042995 RepID=UPI00177CA75E|nr:LytTR family DNA-binding domain-containing protein [Hanstruepera ponticola]